MLQKNTFRELQDNLAKIDRRDVCTRAHDALLMLVGALYPIVSEPTSSLFAQLDC